jgi:peptide-methionine (R)-S-oxide reductase
MKKIFVLIFFSLFISIAGANMFNFLRKSADNQELNLVGKHLEDIDADAVQWMDKDDEYWKNVLTPLQYHVLRKHGTERAFSGAYATSKNAGVYHCSGCDQELFESQKKFESGTGWPSFFDVINKKNVKLIEDRSFGMTRTEVVCSRCGGHLGHVFDDGPQPTGLRYCMNSISLRHKPKETN